MPENEKLPKLSRKDKLTANILARVLELALGRPEKAKLASQKASRSFIKLSNK
jgi:hypothetical protein